MWAYQTLEIIIYVYIPADYEYIVLSEGNLFFLTFISMIPEYLIKKHKVTIKLV